MKFKKIKILGFKSFVDPTEIIIEDGLTGIVGPNGCGKSNVVESLRWCMGETSAKSMRGSGMEDVIFSGTSDRPARNNAEVTIYLDNNERNAPAEFNSEEEIQVRRKIEVERGSEYRVNGKEVRARDVQRLFADLSTGAHSPSLISQGRVGALINAKPIDRRSVLEEAAGISGLHSRRHEAELKLKGAETNLQRLKDIMKQLNAQINSLRKQAEQAETYKNISDEITQLEGIVMYLKWYNLKDSFEKSDENLKNSEQSIQKFTLQVSQAANDQAKASEKIKPLRENEIEAAARLNRINLERESLDREEERIKEVKTTLERSIQQIISDLEREQFQLNDASKDLETLNARKTETDIGHEIEQIDSDQIEKLKVEKDQLESRIEGLEKDIEKYIMIESAKNKLQPLEIILCVLLSAIVIITFTQVLFRYVFQFSLAWTEELARFVFLWLASLSIAYAFKMRSHFALTFLINRIKDKHKIRLYILVNGLMLLFLIVFVWQAVEYNLSVMDQIGPSTGLSMSIPYSSSIVGGLLMIYYVVKEFLKKIDKGSE